MAITLKENISIQHEIFFVGPSFLSCQYVDEAHSKFSMSLRLGIYIYIYIYIYTWLHFEATAFSGA